MIGLALLLVLIAWLGGGDPLGFTGPSSDRYLSAASAHWTAHPIVHETGTFTLDGHRYAVDLTQDREGDGRGALTLDGRRLQYRYAGGRTFLQAGQDYWQTVADQRLAQYLAGRWVTTPSAAQDLSTSSLGRSLGLVDLARPGETFTKKGRAVRVRGVPAVPLHDSTGDLYVSTVSPTRYLRIVSATGYRTAGGASDVRLDLDYPASLSVHVPDGLVDTGDPTTLPARYSLEPGSFRFGGCGGPAGCTLSATVRNLRGPQVGAASAQFDLTKPDGSELGTCSAPIAPAAHDQTEDVSCTVSGQAWSNFTRVGGRYQGKVTIRNPFYD